MRAETGLFDAAAADEACAAAWEAASADACADISALCEIVRTDESDSGSGVGALEACRPP